MNLTAFVHLPKKTIITPAAWYNMTHHNDYWEKEYSTAADTSNGCDLVFSDSSISRPGVTIHFLVGAHKPEP